MKGVSGGTHELTYHIDNERCKREYEDEKRYHATLRQNERSQAGENCRIKWSTDHMYISAVFYSRNSCSNHSLAGPKNCRLLTVRPALTRRLQLQDGPGVFRHRMSCYIPSFKVIPTSTCAERECWVIRKIIVAAYFWREVRGRGHRVHDDKQHGDISRAKVEC